MKYFLAIVLPPVAVFSTHGFWMAFLNLILTLLLFLPGMIHALFMVHSHEQEKRTQRITEAFEKGLGRVS